MATIFHEFCTDKTAFINPNDVMKPMADFPKVCITTFSENIIRNAIRKYDAKIIANLISANGMIPVYAFMHENITMGLFLSRVGAPACVVGLEEVIALGAKKMIQFGNCGILNQAIAGNRIIIPSAAVRDEGTSYHYVSEDEEILADSTSVEFAVQCLEKHGIPYVVGKVWTTDGIYRETAGVIAKRKEQGCLAVEMECSASLAVARFRNIPIIQFLFGGDSLDGDEWEIRDLTDYGRLSCDAYMAIALVLARGWN